MEEIQKLIDAEEMKLTVLNAEIKKIQERISVLRSMISDSDDELDALLAKRTRANNTSVDGIGKCK